MKHPSTTLALLFGFGLQSLTSCDLAAEARTRDAVAVVADTGVVTLEPNQVLRVTAVNGALAAGNHAEGACNGPLWL